jgi:2-polyprenyl-3-methyl-5-hydroxy-6-metoxy-1,4-benzoquinol methylase
VRIGVYPESFVERLGLWLRLVPVPLLETHISATLARSIMAGVELEIFESLESVPLSATDIAKRCRTDLQATVGLVDALVACGYLKVKAEHYALSPQSRKWLLRSSPNSVRDKILLQAFEWQWLDHLEEFVRTGQPLDFHNTMSEKERALYHRSMRCLAGIAGREVAWRTPVPRSGRRMLDLGGSHGHFAASICRRHPALSAQVLDLPDAIKESASLLAAEGLGERVVHIAGDVNETDLGTEEYDLVFMSNLAHHLTEAQNRKLAARVLCALRPGGVFVIQEAIRSANPQRAGQMGSLLGLYFALQSKADVTSWTICDLRNWQLDAGFTSLRSLRLHSAPGWLQQSARRPIGGRGG